MAHVASSSTARDLRYTYERTSRNFGRSNRSTLLVMFAGKCAGFPTRDQPQGQAKWLPDESASHAQIAGVKFRVTPAIPRESGRPQPAADDIDPTTSTPNGPVGDTRVRPM